MIITSTPMEVALIRGEPLPKLVEAEAIASPRTPEPRALPVAIQPTSKERIKAKRKVAGKPRAAEPTTAKSLPKKTAKPIRSRRAKTVEQLVAMASAYALFRAIFVDNK